MSGALQAVFQNQRSFKPPPPGAIGSAYEGGFYAGQIGVSSVATHYLVIGPKASAQGSSKQFKSTNTATPGADSDINGPQNTADMVADGSAAVYSAAHFCNDLVIGGFSDWYLPAKNELEVCYYNLKPSTAANNTSSGINPNAVPARASNYTGGAPASDPARTSASNFFNSTGTEFFPEGGEFWSSTDGSTTTAWRASFYRGFQNNGYKYYGGSVRAVRRVPV